VASLRVGPAAVGFGFGLRQPFGLSAAMRPIRANCAATICTSFEVRA